MTWIQGERQFSDNVTVLKDSQEWKQKIVTLTPPPWAQRVKAGVFVQGKDGRACFDDLVFHEKPGAEPKAVPVIKYSAIGIIFEGTKGMFTGTLRGDRVIEDGTLALVNGAAVADLNSAVEPEMKSAPTAAACAGRIYDFALQELTNYRIEARQGAQGVELRAAVDAPQDAASAPQLRFYVANYIAQGDIEASKPGGGEVEKITNSENAKTLTGIEELLFNAGKPFQLDLMFAKPADVELKREGKRWAVAISIRGELQVSVAPESVGMKHTMLASLAEMKKCFEAKHFGEAKAKLKTFRETYSSRFLQAHEESVNMQSILDNEWRKMRDEVRNAVTVAVNLKTSEAAEPARKTVRRYKEMWTGGDSAEVLQQLTEAEGQIDAAVKAGTEDKNDQEAEGLYRKAEEYYNNEAYVVARSILNKIIREFPNAKTVDKAKILLPKVEGAERHKQEINALQDRLRAKAKNFLLMNDFKSAISAIERDKDYQDNRRDLTEINKLLDEWRKKDQQ